MKEEEEEMRAFVCVCVRVRWCVFLIPCVCDLKWFINCESRIRSSDEGEKIRKNREASEECLLTTW